MGETYGRRKDDMTLPDLNDFAGSLTDDQRVLLKMLQNINSINTALNLLQSDVRVHDKILVTGNGEPSLQERIRNLEAFVASQKYWLRLVAGALVLQTITFGTAAIVYFIKLTPVLNSLQKSIP
jgi:hypothetical protein